MARVGGATVRLRTWLEHKLQQHWDRMVQLAGWPSRIESKIDHLLKLLRPSATAIQYRSGDLHLSSLDDNVSSLCADLRLLSVSVRHLKAGETYLVGEKHRLERRIDDLSAELATSIANLARRVDALEQKDPDVPIQPFW